MDIKEWMRELGEGVVNEAFDDLFSHEIPSPMANRVLRRFSRWWRDYTRAALIVIRNWCTPPRRA
jgi:hypothetical protein